MGIVVDTGVFILWERRRSHPLALAAREQRSFSRLGDDTSRR